MMNPIWKNEEQAGFALKDLYRSYGYIPYKMSRFEEYDLYVRNKDFLVSDQIITFSDRSGRLLAMKPDVTLSIVKNAPEAPGVVQKVYYQENVYRDYREILQAGLECVGDLGDYEIAEVTVPAEWCGHSLIEINVRRKYGLSVIAIRRRGTLVAAPGAEECLQSGDVLVVLGKSRDIDDIQ